MTRRLSVVAHYDPHGEAAPHVLRQLDQLATVSDELVVASTADLTEEARSALDARSTLVERENFGQDFGGWQQVLLTRDTAREFDEVLLTNDTYVGYLRPIERMFADMEQRPVEIWGTHESERVARHLQSFFLVFREPAVRSRAFREFWRRLKPAASRVEAIRQQEIGISQWMLSAGFEIAGYFEPTPAERAEGVRREAWWKARLAEQDVRLGDLRRRAPVGEPVNTAVAFADAALDDGRMPLVKFDTLRYDPYFLGSDRLLELCEAQYPDLFDGVRAFLDRTRASYPPRPGENQLVLPLDGDDARHIGYRAPVSG